MNLETLKLLRSLSQSELADIAMTVAMNNPIMFAKLVDSTKANVVGTIFGNIVVTKHHLDTLDGIHDKVHAVKYLRETFNLNLREAKNLSEHMASTGWVENKPHWYETWDESKDRYWEQAKQKSAETGKSLGDILKEQLRK